MQIFEKNLREAEIANAVGTQGLFGRLMHISASESNTIISYPLLVTRNRVYCVIHQTGLIQL